MCFSLQIGSISNETGKLHVLQEECAFTNLTKFFRFLQVLMYFRNKLSQKETHQIIKSSRFVSSINFENRPITRDKSQEGSLLQKAVLLI